MNSLNPTEAYCRLCACLKPKTKLINLQTEDTKRVEIVTKLARLNADTDFSEEFLPKTVCIECTSNLDKAFDFIVAIEHARITLYDVLSIIKVIKVEEDHSDVITDFIKTEDDEMSNQEEDEMLSIQEKEEILSIQEEDEILCNLEENETLSNQEVDEILCNQEEDEILCNQEEIQILSKQDEDEILCNQEEDEILCNQGEDEILSRVTRKSKYSRKRPLIKKNYALPDTQHNLTWKNVEEEEEEVRSWNDYIWMCQECSLPFLDAASLRSHAQTTHDTCFAMKCADCDKEMKQFKLFVAHVVEHRPYLAKYCQYCNEHFDSVTELNQHILRHIRSQQRPCNRCGQIFKDNHELRAHQVTMRKLSKRKKPTDVSVASKEIKTEKVARKRPKPVSTNEDFTCKQCLKVFESLKQLHRHLIVHKEDRPRNYVCNECGAAFFTSTTLSYHIKKHKTKKVFCEFCKKGFHTTIQLKNHIITHSEARPYACEECGNSFKTKVGLKSHLKSHTGTKPFKCKFCVKDFRLKYNLKTHLYQHTGARPYSCENCDKTFTNWTNCNKHMIRKHGITLARTKLTPKGRMEINRKTGELKNVSTDVKAREWLDEMTSHKKPYENSDS